MKNKYDDMLYMKHHVSEKHPHMSVHDRAAQFSSFAALTGHGSAIAETARLTQPKIELDEYEKEEIDRKIAYLRSKISEKPEISVTYFVPDEKKAGGQYVTYTGEIRRIDDIQKTLLFADETEISVFDILSLDSSLFLTFDTD